MLPAKCKWRHCCRFWALHFVSGVPIVALLVVLQQRLLVAFVCDARLRLVEVFAVVPLGVTCFLSSRVGDTLWPVRALECRQVVSSRHSARTSRVLEVGSQWHGCKCS